MRIFWPAWICRWSAFLKWHVFLYCLYAGRYALSLICSYVFLETWTETASKRFRIDSSPTKENSSNCKFRSSRRSVFPCQTESPYCFNWLCLAVGVHRDQALYRQWLQNEQRTTACLPGAWLVWPVSSVPDCCAVTSLPGCLMTRSEPTRTWPLCCSTKISWRRCPASSTSPICATCEWPGATCGDPGLPVSHRGLSVGDRGLLWVTGGYCEWPGLPVNDQGLPVSDRFQHILCQYASRESENSRQ